MKNFNPLSFLASVGSGGIAVAPFVFFQYTIPHGKGLISLSQVLQHGVDSGNSIFYFLLMGIMISFGLLHFVLTFRLVANLVSFMKTPEYKEYINNPQKNTSILALFTSLGMTFNVFIAVVRYFIPYLHQNFQSLILPALIVWSVLWFFLMRTEIKVLKSAFEKDFDLPKLSFGWLLHPFALSMVTVAGSGIAAMAKDITLANIAAFMYPSYQPGLRFRFDLCL